ncbi:MAG: response regulator [Nitrosopumilales archaeon]|nr:MAG: response regulator [Nitrosopumilales archaeon]
MLFHLALKEYIDGYDVFSFDDPIFALAHFTENKSAYALIITDLRMSDLNGLKLLKKIKDANTSARTILMSGYNYDENLLFRNYPELGVIDSTIEKPIMIQRLCQRVKDELQIYQLVNSR